MYNPTDSLIMSARDITRALTGVMFDSIEVWADGEEDELFIRFHDVPIGYTWDMNKFILKVRYYDFEGMLSHSLLASAGDSISPIYIFCQLLLAVKECCEVGVPYVFYIRNASYTISKRPHEANASWGMVTEHPTLKSYVFKTMIYPRVTKEKG